MQIPEFSARSRAEAWQAVGTETVDLLVIGGGITGVGVARDAALRGYRVALVEKRDFASGTSSKSTKLIHGGLRYLEQFEFGLVFEASKERRVLRQAAPHLVRPQPILFPIWKGAENGFLKVMAGMWLYDILSLFRNIQRHTMLRPPAIDARAPGLKANDLEGAARFFDAQTNDARLTLANAQQAHMAGALLLPYTAVTGFVRDTHGAVAGARLRDELTGDETEIRARLVLNCTGPWTDRLIQMADPKARSRLRPTKGVHLVVPGSRLPVREALMVSAPQDGRLVFIIPWERVTVIGTTDTDYPGDLDNVPVTEEDVSYLLAVANDAFPGAQLSRSDVQSSWAGLRPLISDTNSAIAGTVSREHEIWEHPAGLLNIAGGKLTTYRVMARQMVDEAAERLFGRHAMPARSPAETAALPLPGGEQPFPRENPTRLPDDIWEHLAKNYGTRAYHIATLVAGDETLGARIIPTLPYIWAELNFAVRHEQALTADDFLQRRTWLVYDAPMMGLEVIEEVARRMASLLEWDEARTAQEIARYHHEMGLLAGQQKGAAVPA